MKSTLLDPGARDSHWHTTQSELESVTRRGDRVIAGAAALVVTLALLRNHANEFAFWLIACGLLLAVIVGAVCFVAARKRQVAIRRGMYCGVCAYMPHDTEINEVARTWQCPRCAADL